MTSTLADLGVKIFIGHKAENIQGAEAIVVSSAIRDENPEKAEAKRVGMPILHRSDVNAFLINGCKGIAVAGAHGKTTTTSMLGVVLDVAGVSPSIIIGGELDYLGSNAQLGKSDYLVSEADESDGTFLKYYPHIAIVTNVENDHMDHYGTMENIIKAFTQYINQVKMAVLSYALTMKISAISLRTSRLRLYPMPLTMRLITRQLTFRWILTVQPLTYITARRSWALLSSMYQAVITY